MGEFIFYQFIITETNWEYNILKCSYVNRKIRILILLKCEKKQKMPFIYMQNKTNYCFSIKCKYIQLLQHKELRAEIKPRRVFILYIVFIMYIISAV